MKLLFKQRIFSWFDSYDIYDEDGNTVFVVKGQLAWGHKLKIYDAQGREVGLVREKILTFLPAFELYENGKYIGRIKKKLTLFSPGFDIDFNGWQVDGNLLEWDYTIRDAQGEWVATVSKELFHFSDTYVLEIGDPQNALYVLMFALAMDAEKCSREKREK
ncbi:LURP-one-related family protein [Acidaminococcus timonensis]|mgnify:CR=1 FL=1|uniref:LURP-one-related/scramblase family protein n=1 Tax=Acidaminococcus timonensis TaxID=1871002 RepID=UPI002942C7CC|nr:LURP-one-related family protein [Acidaminococcus timonensis]